MRANRVKHIKKDDNVVMWHSDTKKRQQFIGKVLEVNHKNGKIRVDGVGVMKKNTKPSQQNPKGGITEVLRWWPASRFRVCDSKGTPLGRVSIKVDTSGKKERVYSRSRK
jgi:large subunit ribosomal protein L24